MSHIFLMLGAVSGFLSVAIGAFAAHGLKSRLDDYAMGVFHTGVQYQFYHCFALLAVGILSLSSSSSALRIAGICFIVGTIIFSGSLYTLALSGQKFWGAITPIGGLAFLAGWATLTYAIYQKGTP